MKTVCQIGRDALERIFKTKEVFRITRYEELGMITLKRKIEFPENDQLDLDCNTICEYGDNIYKIGTYALYLWGAEMGLVQIEIPERDEESLMSLIRKSHKSKIFSPSHLVIANDSTKNFYYGDNEDETPYKTERTWLIKIFSLSEEQKKELQ